MEELHIIPTEDLVTELNRRYDVLFMVGMRVEPPPDDEPYDYWISGTYSAASVLCQYALSHYAVQRVREHILQVEDESHEQDHP
jgi:hypothetical protein